MYQSSVNEERCLGETDISTLISSVVVAANDVIGCDLQGEVVMLDLQSGVYYGLDSVGARIWELIQQPISFREVCEIILDEYDAEPEQCERDLCAFLHELIVNGLVELKK